MAQSSGRRPRPYPFGKKGINWEGWIAFVIISGIVAVWMLNVQ